MQVTDRWLPPGLEKQIKTEGLWILEDQVKYQARYCPPKCCKIDHRRHCVKISEIDTGGSLAPLCVVAFHEFGLLWHVDKSELIIACEKRLFQRSAGRDQMPVQKNGK